MSKAESNEDENAESSLLWDCFVNWATTLEKLEKNKVAQHQPNALESSHSGFRVSRDTTPQ
jgi:hypothetical protein